MHSDTKSKAYRGLSDERGSSEKLKSERGCPDLRPTEDPEFTFTSSSAHFQALHRFSTVFIDSTECIDTLLTRVFTLVVIVILLLVVLIFIAFLSLKNVWHRLQKTISPKKYANCD
ncbi:hypothetical protein QR680_004614 [Steinernema hermaphroditum]|uniref:Uncharacterized protein n=1 Tax=Steinernema hermaphroditum TaxID=289476 RepID=A0AA39HP89_9BILA|nr:hypothetical protein QR680_004614 [Steinernema hermaphroditum]